MSLRPPGEIPQPQGDKINPEQNESPIGPLQYLINQGLQGIKIVPPNPERKSDEEKLQTQLEREQKRLEEMMNGKSRDLGEEEKKYRDQLREIYGENTTK